MSLKAVTSRDNPDYKQLVALAEDGKLRRASGMTLLDGEHLIDEAVRAGIQPSLYIVERGAMRQQAWLARLPEARTLELPENLLRRLSPVMSPSGILAVIPIPRPTDTFGQLVLLLDAIQDPGNLGAVLRCAAATGVSDVCLSAGCAEAWSPKALRGGQGGQFHLQVHEAVDLVTWVDAWPGHVYAAMPRAAQSLYDLPLGGLVAMAFGNEGGGLRPELASRCQAFSIPMSGGIESLNVAASVAVCLYERVRQCR
jgi:RNA methyltransferase, TrmH family